MPVIENIPDIEQTFENTEQTIQEKAEHEENKDQKKHSHIHTPRQAFSGFSIVPDFFPDPCLLRLRTPYTGRCRRSVPRGNVCFFHGCTRRGPQIADPTLFQSQLLKMSHRHQIKAKNRKKGKRKTINKSVPISTPPSGVFWFFHRPGLFTDPCLLRLRTPYTGRCRQSVPCGNVCFFHGCTRRCREPFGSFIFVPYRSIGFAFLHYRSFFPV